jgi:hypothetical protein
MASRDRFKIQATPAADRAIRDLRGTTAKRYAQLENELRAQGCAAAGYRLLAPERGDFSPYCCKHLDRRWRVVTTFAPGVARIVAVGEHDGQAFYSGLASALEINPVGTQREAKPACCGDNGWPSVGASSKRSRD